MTTKVQVQRFCTVEHSVSKPIELLTDFDSGLDLVVVKGVPGDAVSPEAFFSVVFVRRIDAVIQVDPCGSSSVSLPVHPLHIRRAGRLFRGLSPEFGTIYVVSSELTNRHAFAADCEPPRACVP